MDKRGKVFKFWELTNAEDYLSRTIQMQWQAWWATVPEVANIIREETGFDIANRVFDIFSVRELMELMLPIMEGSFTEEELDGMITIYESRIGRVLVEKYPLIYEQAFHVVTEYAQRKMQEKLQELDLAEEDDGEEEHIPHTYGSINGGRENP